MFGNDADLLFSRKKLPKRRSISDNWKTLAVADSGKISRNSRGRLRSMRQIGNVGLSPPQKRNGPYDHRAHHHKGLTLSARAEAQIAIKGRPKSAAKEPDPNLTQLTPLIEEVAKNEKRYPEEAFQAQTCVAWLFWSIQDPGRVLSNLPKSIPSFLRDLESQDRIPSRWTKLCAIRSVCIEASILEASKQTSRAVQAYQSILPYLDDHLEAKALGEEYRDWTEQLLINFCLATCVLISERFDERVMNDALHAFRAWMKFWGGKPEGDLSPKSPFLPKAKLLRRIIWRRYHELLARVLQYGGVAQGNDARDTRASFSYSKVQQIRELRRVQSVYEAFIMQEVQYPKADEEDTEVEEWVQEVMGIWYVLYSDEWTDSDLGEGGRDGLTRETLEKLYRATTKTFHSVLIIRHQSTLYYALAEFSMALHTFNTYFDLVFRAKKRLAKSGKEQYSLDKDETILLAIVEAIRMLSAYGTLAEAQRAVELAETLEEWLSEQIPAFPNSATQDAAARSAIASGASAKKEIAPPVRLVVSGSMVSTALCAMGVAKATLASLTLDAGARNGLQDRAVALLKHALSAELGDNDRPEALYALSLLLAEQRDLNGSTAAAKLCLQITSSGKYQSFGPLIPLQVRRSVEEVKAPLASWHLLSLQLTARSLFDMSLDSTEAAINQETPDDSFETPDERSISSRNDTSNGRSSVLDDCPVQLKPNTKLNDLRDTEIDALLRLKMTQLTLVELCDGADVAVNMSGELLNLHNRCYEASHQPSNLQPETQTKSLPRSSSLRSIRGSLFGKKKAARKGIPSESYAAANGLSSLTKIDEDGTQSNPRIHVTHPSVGSTDYQEEKRNGSSNGHGHAGSISKLKQVASLRRHDRINGTSSPKLKRPDSKAGQESRHEMAVISPQPSIRSEGRAAMAPPAVNHALTPSQVGVALSADGDVDETSVTDFGETGSHVSPNSSMSAALANNSPSRPRLGRYYVRPEPRLSTMASKRRTQELLVEIWLFIAGLYRRADLLQDAEDALRQAQQTASEMELEVSKTAAGYDAFSQPAWGRAKTIERLFADILTERGQLAHSREALLEAYGLYEEALTRFPDHPCAIVLLSNILLDFYEEKIFSLYPSEWDPTPDPPLLRSPSSTSVPTPTPGSAADSKPPNPTSTLLLAPPLAPLSSSPSQLQPATSSPPPLNAHAAPEPQDRIAARDRAFGLLSMLTKRGTGWNDSEAWMALARAYELSGQADKAREALWWVVELEGARPLREWSIVARTGYVLA